jgi:menaquinone-9 beta-reductase
MVEATDVFIVGGGPAGLAAAIAAGKKGFRVTVADGGHPPIDKACGEGLLPDTVHALRELGVELDPSEGYAVQGIRFVGKNSEVAARFAEGQGIGMRRPVLHQRLIKQASACGVALRWNTPVTGICEEGVMLAEGLAPAQWIIGADGIGSRVRKWIGLDVGAQRARRYAFRRHHRVRPWSDLMEIYWGVNAQAYVTPVDSEEVCVVVISRQAGIHSDSIATEFPELAWRLKKGTPARAERGAVTMTQRLKGVYRGRVALIGDASGSVDAITGEGLCLGFRQALALGEALAACDLRRYQQSHRRFARGPAITGRLMLLLDGRTILRERALRALASDTDVFSRLLAMHTGGVSSRRFALAGALLGWRFVTA